MKVFDEMLRAAVRSYVETEAVCARQLSRPGCSSPTGHSPTGTSWPRAAPAGDTAASVGFTGEAVYWAAKGGIIAFTKAIAREVARHPVNVNCVCPARPTRRLFRDEFRRREPQAVAESLKCVITRGRLGTPEDVAPAVVFLASDGAGFITGQTLSVSGGLTMV